MDCKRCGAPLLQGVILCPECGARQRRRVNTVRCASCHKTIPLELTVCPHCGRNVRPAGPRWGLWLAGLIGIVLLSLWGLGQLPIARVVDEVTKVREQVAGLVQVLGPVNSPTPSQAQPAVSPTLVAMITEAPASTLPPTPTTTTEATPVPPVETAETPAVAQTEAVPTAATITPATPATATPSPTATETSAPTATASPAPSFTPTRTPTAQPAASDTTTYRVQSGDSLSSIATRFGITWGELAAANGLNSRSVLRIGQELIIPVVGAPLPPTATPTPRPAATPVPPTPTPQPQLAAPELTSPGEGARFDGASTFLEMTWQPVAGLMPGNQYQVIVRWNEQGGPQEHWWLTPGSPTPGTRAPSWLWGRADQPDRKYTWFVRVVQVATDGQGGERIIPLSPPSQTRVFYWH